MWGGRESDTDHQPGTRHVFDCPTHRALRGTGRKFHFLSHREMGKGKKDMEEENKTTCEEMDHENSE